MSIVTEYAYSDGFGTVNFDIDINIEQELPTETSITYYDVTKVVAYAGELNVELSGTKTSADASAYAGTWTGSISDVPFGMADTKYEIYVANEETPRVTVDGSSVVLTNLETTVEGNATISLTEACLVNFSDSSIPTNSPSNYESYSITYDFGEVSEEKLDTSSLPTYYIRLTDEENEAVTIPAITGTYTVSSSVFPRYFSGWKVSGTEDDTKTSTYVISANTAQDISLTAVWGQYTGGGK